MGDAERAARAAADKGKGAARKVEQSTAYQWLVKVGLVFYGIVHLLVATMAIRLALGMRVWARRPRTPGRCARSPRRPWEPG